MHQDGNVPRQNDKQYNEMCVTWEGGGGVGQTVCRGLMGG